MLDNPTEYPEPSHAHPATPGLVPETAAIEARVKPAEFKKLADKACSAKLADLGTLFPNVQEAARPFFCMDLCYVHTLLLEGFRVPEETEVTIVKKVGGGGEGEGVGLAGRCCRVWVCW